ncbi:hypothetical protein, partial [Clostridioides difficile]|uniref:hypothetical protein n=1 Tax=Clostridioides difficile TaxID=1496 RepID=UPI001CA5F3C6
YTSGAEISVPTTGLTLTADTTATTDVNISDVMSAFKFNGTDTISGFPAGSSASTLRASIKVINAKEGPTKIAG